MMNKIKKAVLMVLSVLIYTSVIAQDKSECIIDTIRQKDCTVRYCFDVILSHEGRSNVENVIFLQINVIDKETSSVFQTINFDESNRLGYNVFIGDNMIVVDDYNFDGNSDFCISTWCDNRLERFGYRYYLFDASLNKFVNSEFLNGLCIGYDHDGSGFDSINKTITELCYTTRFEALKSIYKFNDNGSVVLLSSDSVYFAPINSLNELFGTRLFEDFTWAELYGMGYDSDPWNAIFHTFPVKEKENASVYLKLALIYSQDSLTYENDMDDNISEVIIRQVVEAFPEDESGWLACGDILYNKYLLTKDEDALSDMEDAYERYIELMTGQRKKTKIPQYVYERIKECEL